MRKALALSFIVGILTLAAYFFKPSEAACINKAKEEFKAKSFYTIQSSPKEVDKNLLAKTLENNFLQALEVKDNFIYRTIYQNAGGKKNTIGWGALGWVSVDIK